jgi:hypothetical protein
MHGRAAGDEQVRQHIDDVEGVQLACHPDGQAFAGELIHHVQHAELAPVARPVLHEVIGPDMMRTLGAQPHAGAVVEPEPPTPGLASRHLQPLTAPDALHPLVV